MIPYNSYFQQKKKNSLNLGQARGMRGSRDRPLAKYFVNHPQKINQIYLQFKQFTSSRHKPNVIFKILFLHTSTFCVGVVRFQVVRPSTCLPSLFLANWVETAFFV